MTSVHDYRSILREQFALRCRANSLYSMRAFARDLKVSPSKLSEVFNGRQGLSRATAKKIAIRLGFGSDELELFCDSAESQHGKSEVLRKLATTRLEAKKSSREFKQISEDTFRAISDWYHMAIVQLVLLEGFDGSVEWIAAALKIKLPEAKEAVARLERLGFIEVRDGKICAHDQDVCTTDDVPSSAIREFHRQILAKASTALCFQSLETRDSSAMIMPIARRDFGRAKAKIKKFRRELSAEMNETPTKDALYCLSVQFFEL